MTAPRDIPQKGRQFGSLIAMTRDRRSPANATRAALTNTGWLLLDKVLRICISVFVGAWVARHLGPENYGELAYVLALLALFQAACVLGLDGPVVRDIAQDPRSASAILGSAFFLRAAAGTLGWLIAVGIVVALRPGDTIALTMIAIAGAALIFQPAELVDLWLQSQSRSRVSISFRFAAYCAVAMGKVVLILADAPLWAFSVAALADAILVAAALTLVYTRKAHGIAWRWDRLVAKKLLAESWPFMVSAISIGVYIRIDQIMLRELADERQLGLYSAVMPFSQAWHMIPMTLCASLMPLLAKLQQQDPIRYRYRLQQVFSLMVWSGAAVAGLTVILAPWLVRLLLGSQYENAVSVLQWHAITNIFIFMGVAQSLVMVNERTPRVALSKTLLGALVNVVANFILIPKWGAIGSAWAAVIAHFLSGFMLNSIVAPQSFRMQLRALIPFYPGWLLPKSMELTK